MEKTDSDEFTLARRGSLLSISMLEDPDYYVDIKDITIGPLLGSGAFSVVHIGRYFGDLVAVKKQTRDAATIEKYLLQELTVLKNLKNAHHENVVAYIGACNEISTGVNPHALYILTEYCQGGDLLPILLNTTVTLGWKFRVKLAHQAACAINYLHDNNFIHRDIKSANFLLDHNLTIKLTDFGLSRIVSDPFTLNRMTICGTPEYMAPEMLFQEEYSSSVDIFSLGLVLFELMTRSKVDTDGFIHRKPQNNFEIDVDDAISRLPADAPSSMVMLAQQCVLYDSSTRPIGLEVQDWLQDLLAGMPDDTVPLPPLKEVPGNFDVVESPRAVVNGIGGNGGTGVGANDSDNAANRITKTAPSRLLSVSVEQDNLIRRTGTLSKRNATGLRNWKKLVFTLHRSKLSWPSSSGETKFMDLRGASVQKTHALRFQIHTLEKDDSSTLNKELAAESGVLLDAWIRDIKEAIQAANEEAAYEIEKAQIIKEAELSTGKQGALRVFTSVSDWLDALGLPEYKPNFKAHNYEYHMICDMGLKEADFVFLGIDNPRHRAVLIASAKPAYSSHVKIVLTGTRQFDSVVVYNVVSRYKFFRSCLCLRFTDFKKFDTVIRRLVKTKSTITTPLPALPGQTPGILGLRTTAESKDVTELISRQHALEAYMNAVAAVLQETPLLRSLLEFLDLQSA